MGLYFDNDFYLNGGDKTVDVYSIYNKSKSKAIGGTVSSLDSGSDLYGNRVPSNDVNYSKLQSALLKSINSAYKSLESSALKSSLAAARETNNFNAQQAELNRQFQQSSADKQMAFEAEQAQKAQDFSAEMSNTQYQRAVADLKAAGLSPLLAYGNMQTSSPQGVMASGSSAAGSSASGVKADTSSAIDVDRKSLDRLLSLITLNVNSALEVSGQSIKLFNALMPF